MGIVVVDLCQANPITSIEIEELLEREFPEVAVLINDCLSFCGLCARTCFAQVNGKLVHGKTVEECLERIRQEIRQQLAAYE